MRAARTHFSVCLRSTKCGGAGDMAGKTVHEGGVNNSAPVATSSDDNTHTHTKALT